MAGTSTDTPAAAHRLRPVTPVGILAGRLQRALELAGGLSGPEIAGLIEELEAASALASGLESYVERCTTPVSSQLVGLAQRTREHDWSRAAALGPAPALEAEMLSGHVEAQLLKFLVAMTGATRVLDIGMFTGYSALAVAEALPDGGRVIACEVDLAVAEFARHGFEASADGAKIEVRVGPAAQTLEHLSAAGQQFDLAFVDADKAGYRGYVSQLLELDLLAPGGTICVDNTLMQGEPWTGVDRSGNGAAIADFNDWVAGDPRVEQLLVPLRDGVTLIRRR